VAEPVAAQDLEAAAVVLEGITHEARDHGVTAHGDEVSRPEDGPGAEHHGEKGALPQKEAADAANPGHVDDVIGKSL
jgi:hypothetical protein